MVVDSIFNMEIISNSMDLSSIYQNIKLSLDEIINGDLEIDDNKIYEIIDREIENLSLNYKLSIREKIELRNNLFSSYRRLGILEELLKDKEISEIMINSYNRIFVEKAGKVEQLSISFENKEQLEDVIQQIVSKVNRIVNTSKPIVDARLSDGSRVHIVLNPISIKGPTITIRKFPEPITMKKLVEFKAVDEKIVEFLKKLIYAKYNIFICGGTNSGKTTFLNALSEFIPKDERVITIEDSAELNLSHIENIVSLETKNENSSGEGAIYISDLIKAALRMNPDRIIVGEVRGKEALDMLQAMNTGYDGSLSTGHANSPKDMLTRLETMVLGGTDLPLSAIRAQIAGAIDIIIHLGRLRDKKRRLLSIVEIGDYVEGKIETRSLYEFEEKESSKEELVGEFVKKAELKERRKLREAGIKL